MRSHIEETLKRLKKLNNISSEITLNIDSKGDLETMAYRIYDAIIKQHQEYTHKYGYGESNPLFEFKPIDLLEFKPSFYKFPKMTKENINKFSNFLKSDDNLIIPDYEIVGTKIELIQYKPFITKFYCSGKIILENDLRDFFNEADYNINSKKGITQTMRDYAKQGMLHGFVGNSCPGFYLNKEKTEIQIGAELDNETDEPILPDRFKNWGSVCTDLWWYSLVDYEQFKQLTRYTDEKINNEFAVLELPNGIWKLEHSYGISSHSSPYGIIKKVN